jgi:hypothetical protein
MDSRQLFETTVYDEGLDVAIGIVTVPTEALPTARLASSPAQLLDALSLRTVGEVRRAHLPDAIAAMVATDDVSETVEWLEEPPNVVPVELPPDVLGLVHAREIGVPRLRADESRLPPNNLQALPKRRHRERRKISKGDPMAEELHGFAQAATQDALVPFQQSPLDIYSISEVLRLGDEVRTFIVTVGKTPHLLLLVPGGFMLWSTVRGAASGVRSGLYGGISAGLKYRLLKLFGLPEDIIRAQMDAPPRRRDE